ncbi:hypothetical protein [Halopiger djelfimassiliensis]|uniref:hypothetical protein n=1 Tax=Halopiger djelfimassiliensis TaxID=1293047 RepID=UPI000A460E7A|nr:hypothetical protein [Halopiger djelfimassiliensis]
MAGFDRHAAGNVPIPLAFRRLAVSGLEIVSTRPTDDRPRDVDADDTGEEPVATERPGAADHDDEGDHSVTPSDGGDRSGSGIDAVSVTFRDCETVRITGDLDEVILSVFWWDESGTVGTLAETVGGVDGERIITATEVFGEFAYGPIVSGVDCFAAGTPIVPGGGDVSVSRPDVDDCVTAVRAATDGPVDLEQPFPDRSGADGS